VFGLVSTYTAKVRIEHDRGPVRRGYLPAEAEPVIYGLHGPVATHYGVDESVIPPRASTLDHVVAAAAACLSGTFAAALASRKINPRGLVTKAEGRIDTEDGVLVIKRIDVAYNGLQLTPEQRPAAEEVLATHAKQCPVARSLEGAVEISTRIA